MKDWYMVFVFLVIIATPFLPGLLKGRCPECKKKKLEMLETLCLEPEEPSEQPKPNGYMTFYRCHACQGFFKRQRSGPLLVSSSAEHDELKLRQKVV